ncbi:MAG: hypothetical protein M0Z69_10880 [Actinomycetota bacterium]|nr:hypothetical protein [Actinomycetota bacterium]
MSTAARAVVAFGRFWRDFLVGDTPELFVATLVLVGLAIAFGHTRSLQSAGIPVVLVAVVGSLALSTWRGRRRGEPPRR